MTRIKHQTLEKKKYEMPPSKAFEGDNNYISDKSKIEKAFKALSEKIS